MTKGKIEYIAEGVKWLDKVNGNTYHSARVTRCADGAQIVAPFQYGYGDSYRHSALSLMIARGWLPAKYNKNNIYAFERENNYPIYWTVEHTTKRACKANGEA